MIEFGFKLSCSELELDLVSTVAVAHAGANQVNGKLIIIDVLVRARALQDDFYHRARVLAREELCGEASTAGKRILAQVVNRVADCFTFDNFFQQGSKLMRLPNLEVVFLQRAL